MRKIFLISDTHFGHENFLKFRDDDGNLIRPFSSVEEMDELMIDNWNSTVKDHDIVYHLGDVYMKDGWKHLSKLKGKKRLIVGNHDVIKKKVLYDSFQKIYSERIFNDENVPFGVLLTHRPVIIPGDQEKFIINIHGHIHQNKSPSPEHINVSVEAINYKPIEIEEACYRYERNTTTS